VKKIRNVLLATAVLAAGALAGCGHGYYAVSVGPPPPPPVYGPVGYAPAPGFVWTDGFYDLQGERWVWVPGRWVQSPRPDASWERPYWERRGNGYRFHKGHWR
jgi:hypothetical protein